MNTEHYGPYPVEQNKLQFWWTDLRDLLLFVIYQSVEGAMVISHTTSIMCKLRSYIWWEAGRK